MSAALFCGRCGGVKSGLIAGKVKLCDCGANANMADVLAENASLRNQLSKAIACLKLIEQYGGTTTADEAVNCNGSWCAEQARRCLEECG